MAEINSDIEIVTQAHYKDLTHYYEVILKRLKTQPVKPPLTPQEMDKIMKRPGVMGDFGIRVTDYKND